jgi:hypothetical protein
MNKKENLKIKNNNEKINTYHSRILNNDDEHI